MIYRGLCGTERQQLESFETSGAGGAKVAVQSTPPVRKSILMKTSLAHAFDPCGRTGKHAFRLHAAGRADWSRQVNVLTGSDITLTATLDKN